MKKLLLTVMLMFGFAFIGCNANDSTPEGVILAFVEAVKKGDLEKAKSYCDKKSFDVVFMNGRTKNFLDEEVEGFYRKLKEDGDISKWIFNIKFNEHNSGRYYLYMQNIASEHNYYKDGTEFDSFDVNKIGNKLKITSIIR